FRMAHPFRNPTRTAGRERRRPLASVLRQCLLRRGRAAAALYARRRLFHRCAAPSGRGGAHHHQRGRSRAGAFTWGCLRGADGQSRRDLLRHDHRARDLRRHLSRESVQGAHHRACVKHKDEHAGLRRSREAAPANHDPRALGAFLELLLPQARGARGTGRRSWHDDLRLTYLAGIGMSGDTAEIESRFVGKPLHRREDARLLQGKGRFGDDLAPPGTLWCAFARSPHAHAHICRISTDAAAKMPGVLLTLTAEDWKTAGHGELKVVHPMPFSDGRPMNEAPRPAFASRKVHHVGDIVAAVVAESRWAAEDGAEAVEVDYEALPAVTGVPAAV